MQLGERWKALARITLLKVDAEGVILGQNGEQVCNSFCWHQASRPGASFVPSSCLNGTALYTHMHAGQACDILHGVTKARDMHGQQCS